MFHQVLEEAFVKEILDYLGCTVKTGSLRELNRLIHAYIRRVPWESVSRIVKRQTTTATAGCPRWPEEFWRDAIRYGFGGTCYESSLAFYSLLNSLGYEGYLTVNDMGTSRACHAAIVIIINERKYLVDITIPLHSAVRFSPHRATRRSTPLQSYSIRPVAGGAGVDMYEVERLNQPNRYAFTFIDTPVPLPDYRAIVENDYTQEGLFLNKMVMVKVIEDKTWRFYSDHQPYRLESFDRGGKHEIYLAPDTWMRSLAEKFHMPEDKIGSAFLAIQEPVKMYSVAPMSSSFASQVRAS